MINYEKWSDRGLEHRLYDLLLEDAPRVKAPYYCTDYKLTRELGCKHRVWVSDPLCPTEGAKYYATASYFNCYGGLTVIGSSDYNPLRAIVICLIKVLEAENAKRKLL